MADTDNKLDPFTIITAVQWSGGGPIGVLIVTFSVGGGILVPVETTFGALGTFDIFQLVPIFVGTGKQLDVVNPVTNTMLSNIDIWERTKPFIDVNAGTAQATIFLNLHKIKTTTQNSTLVVSLATPAAQSYPPGFIYWGWWNIGGNYPTLASALATQLASQLTNVRAFDTATARDAYLTIPVVGGPPVASDQPTAGGTFSVDTECTLRVFSNQKDFQLDTNGQPNPPLFANIAGVFVQNSNVGPGTKTITFTIDLVNLTAVTAP